jgi:superfamily II RNA helicase
MSPPADAVVPAPLALPPGTPATPDDLLERFLAYADSVGLSLYPAQEEAILELFAGRHVVLNTPTGSGKSLVALALHFKALAEGGVSVYTSPIKALVNEKFFALCEAFGPERVGMLTGDASINRGAPVLCCTAEILANMALREGQSARVDAVILDEFHYYADRERGWAWQVPLLELPRAQFLLMSATLGDTTAIEAKLKERTGREVTAVRHATRPVPLDYDYRLTPLHETIADLCARNRSPIYLVNFTQRAAAEEAQNLTSLNLCSKEEKQAIKAALLGFRFDTPYGKELQRFLHHGIGLHHAGLLPRYRRLVERLAQQNLLRVVSGTDTLGVGVNIPLRTVLFTQLCKYDGEKTVVLSVRDFQQIAGRAGRKGFDDRGWVVAQAPEHVIENLALDAKIAQGKKKVVKRKPPEKGYVHFDDQTFERLRTRLPEPLESRFEVNHAMLLQLMQRTDEPGHAKGYGRLLKLIAASHESEWNRRRQKRLAATLFRTLRRAGIVEVVPVMDAWPPRRAGSTIRVSDELQHGFSMNQTLSLYLVETLPKLDPESPTHALEVLTLVESILESPKVVLQAQVHKAKGERIAELKSQGMEYDQRMEELEKVEHPKPNAEFVYETFNAFADRHPWLGDENVRPKSITRELVETGASFNEYVRDYGLERSEGVLLRYLSDSYRTLLQNVPEAFRTEAVEGVIAFVRATLAAVDTSLLDEWAAMRDPDAILARAEHRPPPSKQALDPAANPRAFAARIRAELHRFARALARRDWEEALGALHDPDAGWDAARLEAQVAPLFAEHAALDTTPRSRAAHLTRLEPTGPRTWRVQHTLLAADGDDLWMAEGSIDLTKARPPEAPLVELVRVGT